MASAARNLLPPTVLQNHLDVAVARLVEQHLWIAKGDRHSAQAVPEVRPTVAPVGQLEVELSRQVLLRDCRAGRHLPAQAAIPAGEHVSTCEGLQSAVAGNSCESGRGSQACWENYTESEWTMKKWDYETELWHGQHSAFKREISCDE